MFAAVRDYVVQNVLPAYREFCAKRRAGGWGENQQLRVALNVAGALYHLREQFPNGTGPTYRAIAGACDDYAIVRDMWNAAKHHDCDRNDTRVSSAEQLYEMLISTRYEDEQGEYIDARVEVFVSLDDGTERLVAELLHNVMEMWRVRLRDLNVIDLPQQSEAPNDRPRSREDVVKQGDLAALALTQGEGAKLRMKICKYDYANGRPDPIDLTDAKIEMRVFKLPTSVPLTITDPESGHSFDLDVPLSETQAKEYMSLRDPEKRAAFVGSLLQADAGLTQAVATRLVALRSASGLDVAAPPPAEQRDDDARSDG